LSGETIRDVRFLDDDERLQTMLGLMEFVLKATTHGARLMKG
jgi:hypothetical protein